MSEQFISLTIATTSGDVTERFNVNQKTQVVFNRALTEVGGGVDRGAYSLEFEEDVLDLEVPIGDYVEQFGWTGGTLLELVPTPIVV